VTVSVIMPVYNGSRYLAETLDSVLAQTYPLHEIIAIDDGSTDASPEILRSYGDRLQVIRQANQGVAAARNAGLARATGEFITFIDQDDLWPPQRTQALVDALRARPEARLAAGRVEILYQRPAPPHPTEDHATAHRECLLGSLCVRAELFRELGAFNVDIGFADDTDFMLRRAERKIETAYLQAVTLIYRLHECNTSADKDVTMHNFMAALRQSLIRRRRDANKLHHPGL
jgi:glycosyltransferase involved in cell wall biosynthesis